MARTKWHEALAERTQGMRQTAIAESLGVRQPQVSRYFGKKPDAPGGAVLARALARFGVPIELAGEPLSEASDSAHPCEVPQAAQMPRENAFSAPATDAAPVSQVSP